MNMMSPDVGILIPASPSPVAWETQRRSRLEIESVCVCAVWVLSQLKHSSDGPPRATLVTRVPASVAIDHAVEADEPARDVS